MAIIRTLLSVEAGVIFTVNPVIKVGVDPEVALYASVLTTDCTCKIDPAGSDPIFAPVTALVASMSVSTMPSGNPPTDTPVIVPDPLMLIAMVRR